MKKYPKYLAVFLLATSFSLAATPHAHAQDDVKAANKINKKRNKLKAASTDLSKDALNYDSEFVVAAASGNMLEMALGELAQQKALATEVKDWGQQMAREHGQAEQELKTIADQAHITLPASFSKDDRKLYDDVDDRKYLGFDKKYLRTLKELHERTIRRFTEAAAKLTNPELRAYATRMLPVLQQHAQATDQLFDRANDRK